MNQEQQNDWAGPAAELGAYIKAESDRALGAYRAQPSRVTEDANKEEDTARGGYANRQLFELIQNSADALLGSSHGRIAIRLCHDYLYCADDGKAIDQPGVQALLLSHLSPKRGTSEIGRFGLGFKSVLGVTDVPEFFSRSGSFRFDRDRAREQIRQVVPDARDYPTLRLAYPIDPHAHREQDEVLRALMAWANNVVRLPLKDGVADKLAEQIRNFPPEFLLFVKHVQQLTFDGDSPEYARTLKLEKPEGGGGDYRLEDDSKSTRWKLFQHEHLLSDAAKADRRALDDSDRVPIWWAAPVDSSYPGKFWAFFPTHTSSLLAGILNAPWKTNEDRQNLLPGPYNEELIKEAVDLVAEALPQLATEEDPARHLDALPRRREAGDSEHIEQLRSSLSLALRERKVVPDQDGELRIARKVKYPPTELPKELQELAFECWAACPTRPRDWAHHGALRRNRLAAIGRLFPSDDLPRESVATWLEALVKNQTGDDAIEGSKEAIQIAELIYIPGGATQDLGRIVLAADGSWQILDPELLFLPDEVRSDGHVQPKVLYVHQKLARDIATYRALQQLGLRPLSPEIPGSVMP